MEGLATLNHTLMIGFLSCLWVFGGRAHSSASPLYPFGTPP